MNTTQKLLKLGQSVWYDNIQRSLLRNGALAGMIERREIRGITSNPSIFMNAITKSADYDDSLLPLAKSGLSPKEIFYNLAVGDIQAATDLFLPLYRQSRGGDGYVSLEVSPYLANDTAGTLEEAAQLWRRVGKPNLMIKIPATKAGIPAVAQATAAGLNINVTLIFSRLRYAEVMEAYLSGLEERTAQGLPVDTIASVASFFVSRVDTKVDGMLERLRQNDPTVSQAADDLLGKAAIANAKLAYADFKKVFSDKRFAELKKLGAHVQRPLWASTSTKNPAYRDVIYVEELIGPDTVNTMPPQTLAAFLDHGQVRLSLEQDADGAKRVMADLARLGVSMEKVTDELEVEGVRAFADAFTLLLEAVEQRVQEPQ